MRRVLTLLLLSGSALAYMLLARRPEPQDDVWDGLEKDWYG